MKSKNWWRKIYQSWWFPWLLGGVVLRLGVMAITAHSDLWAFYFAERLFVFKGVINIYDYLANLPAGDPLRHYGTNFFTYPPLAYFLFGFFGLILRPFLSADFYNWVVNHYPEIYSTTRIYGALLIQKFPLLFFDLATAFVLMALFKRPKNKRRAFFLWLFNPWAFYAGLMVGQFDIIPVFFVVWSLYFLKKEKKTVATFCLGLGGALKMFPLLFLPFLILVFGKSFWERAKLAFWGLLPYVLTVFPFLGSLSFRQTALLSPQTQKMFFMSLPVSGAEGIPLFAFFYFLLLILAAYHPLTKKRFWVYLLGVLLLFFSVTHYHPQWFLWLTPFLIIELVKNNLVHRWLVLIMGACFLVILAFFEPSLHLGLLAPVWPAVRNLSGGFEEVFIGFMSPFMLKSLVRGLFAAAAVFLFYLNYKGRQKSAKD